MTKPLSQPFTVKVIPKNSTPETLEKAKLLEAFFNFVIQQRQLEAEMN